MKQTPGAWLRHQLLPRLTLLVGLFCAYSQVSTTLHWVLVQHVRCAEHGDWVHGEEHGHVAAAGAATASASFVAVDGESHEHDHCHFLVDPRELALRPSAQVGLRPEPAGAVRASVRLAEAGAGSALYELAPKTSPPARSS